MATYPSGVKTKIKVAYRVDSPRIAATRNHPLVSTSITPPLRLSSSLLEFPRQAQRLSLCRGTKHTNRIGFETALRRGGQMQ